MPTEMKNQKRFLVQVLKQTCDSLKLCKKGTSLIPYTVWTIKGVFCQKTPQGFLKVLTKDIIDHPQGVFFRRKTNYFSSFVKPAVISNELKVLFQNADIIILTLLIWIRNGADFSDQVHHRQAVKTRTTHVLHGRGLCSIYV